LETIKCFFEKILFNNNDFTAVAYKTDYPIPNEAMSKYPPKTHQFGFTATGSRLPTVANLEIELVGEWTTSKYGLGFKVKSCTVARPKTVEGIKAYLSSNLIKGIGPQTAEQIINKFGVQSLDVLEKNPRLLLNIPGITEDKLQQIVTGFNNSSATREIMTALAGYDVTPKKAEKILAFYGAQAVEIVKDNPYALCSIHGFGFKTIDKMAQKAGVEVNDSMRIKEGIMFTLSSSQQLGHLFLMKHEICIDSLKLLGEVDTKLVDKELLALVVNKRIVKDGDNYYLPKNYQAETETAKLIKKLIKHHPVQNTDAAIAEAEKVAGINLANNQRNAIKMALSSNFSIITGGPGTGKTTVIKALVHAYKLTGGGKVAFAAPTGRASRRLSESVGEKASTLHSALGITVDNTEAKTSIEADFLVVDETSMIDMALAYQLFKNISCKLVFVGDVAQLPSVGAGNVLRELINSKQIPVTRLNVVQRQAATSRINLNAMDILKNNTNLAYGQDFIFIESDEDISDVVQKVFFEEIRQLKPNGKAYGVDGVQILCPMRQKLKTSAELLNKEIQSSLNPKSNNEEISVGFNTFRRYDKVMQTRNNGDVSNGDIGRIMMIEKGICTIKFGDVVVEYTSEDMESMVLAYATTIHKSQGSEYPVVIIPMHFSSFIMLKRNLIYTAITRAKSKVILIGQKKALFTAIHTADTARRNTVLGSLL